MWKTLPQLWKMLDEQLEVKQVHTLVQEAINMKDWVNGLRQEVDDIKESHQFRFARQPKRAVLEEPHSTAIMQAKV